MNTDQINILITTSLLAIFLLRCHNFKNTRRLALPDNRNVLKKVAGVVKSLKINEVGGKLYLLEVGQVS